MKPVIGIISGLTDISTDSPFKGCKMHSCVSSYIDAIEKNDGIPLLIPVLKNFDSDTISSILKKIDGLLIPGGIDVNPKLYNEKVSSKCGNFNDVYNIFQLSILKTAFSINLPILGICRGIQLINVSLGGSLYQDNSLRPENSIINHRCLENCQDPIHTICIKKDTLMYEIFEQTSINVNSIHHQSIKTLGHNLTVSAISEDNVIETVENKNKKFLLAVQFHPEVLRIKHPEMNKIFSAFIKSC